MVANLQTSTPSQDFGYRAEQVMRRTITFADSGLIAVGGLPTGGVILGTALAVGTAFNSGSTGTISIGYSDSTGSSAAAYAAATTVTAVGVTLTHASGSAVAPLSRPTTVTATLAQTGTAATAGSADVIIRFVGP